MNDTERSDRESRREALDRYFEKATGRCGNGLADYVQRLRSDHQAIVRADGGYGGCICGELLCSKDFLLAWADELIASYEAKVQELAAETLRSSGLSQQIVRMSGGEG